MSQPTPDARAVVRALDALTTQVKRIADHTANPATFALAPPVADTDDTPTTAVYCPLCPEAPHLPTPAEARDHFTTKHPEQRLVGTGPWPKLAVDDGATTPLRSINAADVQGFCPACGHGVLMLGDGGHVVCTLIDCPDPDAVDTLLTRTDDEETTGSGALRARVTKALTDEWEERVLDRVTASPKEHIAAMATAVMRIVRPPMDPVHILGAEPDPDPDDEAADEDEEDPPAACWHIEPTTPCDWDVCRQPERLAAGDVGTDPATTPPVGPVLRQRAEQAPAVVPDFTSPIAGRVEVRKPCPYCGDHQMIPRHQFQEHVARLHPDVRTDGPAAGEEQQRTARRVSLRVLITRVNNGLALTTDEAQLLARHVATEISDANTGYRLTADLETADRIRAEAQRDRDQHAAVLREVLDQFSNWPKGGTLWPDGGVIARVSEEEWDRWDAVVASTVERPWWEQLAELRAGRDGIREQYETLLGRWRVAQAGVERVRQMADGWEQRLPETILTATAVEAIRAALDGTEQDTAENTEALHAKLDEATATLRRVRTALDDRPPILNAEGQGITDYETGWRDHDHVVRDALAGPRPDPQPTTEG